MITINQPAIALNDVRVKTSYWMRGTQSIEENESCVRIFERVVQFAKAEDDGKINVVINCHGTPGRLQIGQGVGRSDLPMFSLWYGIVEKIWITSCGVGFIDSEGSETDGNYFCSQMAKWANCYVVAPTETQFSEEKIYPFGEIDSFEGLVLSYGPKGDVTWRHRYPSDWKSNWE